MNIVFMKNTFKNILCNRIKYLIKKHNMTAEMLAYQSGISKGGLSEILNCKKCPTSFTIAKIRAVFDITLKEFYNYKDFDEFIENLSIHS